MHQATIELRFNSGDARTIILETGEHRIGREHGDLVLADHRVSALHGQITIDADGVLYRDLGSSNGSFDSSGQRLDGPLAVPIGKSVRLGNTSLKVIAHSDIKAPLSTPPRPKRAPQKTMMMVPSLGMAEQPPPSTAPEQPPSTAQSAPQAAGAPPVSESTTAPPSSAPPSSTASAHANATPGQDTGAAQAGSVWDLPNSEPTSSRPQASTQGESLWAESERRVRATVDALLPHWQPIAKLIAMLTIPFAVARWAVGLVPVAGLILTVVLSMAELAILVFFIQGIVSQYALQIHEGEQPTLAQSRLAHSRELGSWAITLLLSGGLTFVGFLCLFVPGMILGWGAVPALLVHRQTGFDASLRSAKIFMADWRFVSRGLVGLVLASVAVQVSSNILQAILPGQGLDTLVVAASYTLSLPFSALYTLDLYREACQRNPDVVG